MKDNTKGSKEEQKSTYSGYAYSVPKTDQEKPVAKPDSHDAFNEPKRYVISEMQSGKFKYVRKQD